MKALVKFFALVVVIGVITISCDKEEGNDESKPKDITPNLNVDVDTTITVGESITFENSNLDFITGLEWTFEGGTPATSTDAIPTVTYNTLGTYDVTLVVTDGSRNDTIKAEDLVEVIPVEPVTAAFSSDTTVFKANSIAFTSDSNTNVVSWQWEFEGGTPATSTAQNPTITYDTVGFFDVKLIVSSRNRTDTILSTEYVEAIETDTVHMPDANFRNQMINNYDTNNDGRLSKAEALAVTSGFATSNAADLTGIEEFKNIETLTSLSSVGNTFATIDLSQNNKLEELIISTGLTSIQLPTDAPNIDRIQLDFNDFTNIDLSGVTNVRLLTFRNNKLTSLDVSNLTNSSLFLRTVNATSFSCIKINSSQNSLVSTWDLDAGTTTSTASCP